MQHEQTERLARDEDQQRYLVSGHNGPVKVQVKLEHPVRDGFWLSVGAFLLPVLLGLILGAMVLLLWSGPASAATQRFVDCDGGVCRGSDGLGDYMRGVGSFSDAYTTDIMYGLKGTDELHAQYPYTAQTYTVMDPDKLYGGDDADLVLAGGGQDLVRGGAGADRLWGGYHQDTIYGDKGDDWLKGADFYQFDRYDEAGDKLYGGADTDSLYGGYGPDRLTGGQGFDLLYGERGNDVLIGRDDANKPSRVDRLNCGDGKDIAYADKSDKVAPSCERVRRR